MPRFRAWTYVGKLGDIPLWSHWSLPIAILVGGYLMRSAVAPLGLLVVLLAHELGHAAVARAVGGVPLAIRVHAAGGLCEYSDVYDPLSRSLVAWGGFAGQAVLLVATLVIAQQVGSAQPDWLQALLGSIALGNALLVLPNLLPFPPLDGAQAWRLFPILLRRVVGHLRASARPSPSSPRVREEGRRATGTGLRVVDSRRSPGDLDS